MSHLTTVRRQLSLGKGLGGVEYSVVCDKCGVIDKCGEEHRAHGIAKRHEEMPHR